MVEPLYTFATITLALGLFAVVGFKARTTDTDLEDYLVARNSQKAGLLGLSFFASGLGVWILFAPPEIGAVIGLTGVVGYAVAAAGPFAVFALLGPRLRLRVPAGHSLTEFVRLRFGRGTHVYVVTVSILYMLTFLTAELTAVGAVTAIVSGVGPRWAVVATAAVTLAYTAYGGLRASLRTDRWQAWLVLALLGVGAGAVVAAVDAPGAALAASGLLDVDRVGVEAAATLVLAVIAANLFHQGYWQRVWAARDTRALRRGAVIGITATAPVVAIVGILGTLAAGAGLALGDPPAPFFALFSGLPAWLGVVVLLLSVCLVASSVDTLENGLASLVAVERPGMSLGAARWATVLLMVPATVVAFQGYSVLRILLIADLLCATVALPALLGLWRRATAAGALSGAVAGVLGAILPGLVTTGSFVEAVRGATFPGGVPTLPPFLGAVAASTVVAVAVSLTAGSDTDVAALNERVPALSRQR